jgi:chromosome segregation ATPase
MVLVPAFGQRQEAPPPPPPAEEKPIIPRRMYGLLIASAIAGVSLAANAFLGARYMSIRSENVAARQQLAAQSKEAQDRFTKLDKDYTVLQERHRIFEAEEKSGTELRAQAERLRASIQSVATTAGIRATELGPVPELRTAWTSSLYGYIESQQKELTRLEAEARRRGQAAAAAAAAQAKREAPVVPPSSRGAPTPPR